VGPNCWSTIHQVVLSTEWGQRAELAFGQGLSKLSPDTASIVRIGALHNLEVLGMAFFAMAWDAQYDTRIYILGMRPS